MFVQFLCLISLIYVDSTVQICFISHSYLINGTFPYGCITVVYNYILGQLILHNCAGTCPGGGAQGAWAPLEIKKQKKKGHQCKF